MTLLSNIWLSIRSVLMTIIFPGTVTAYIPYRLILRSELWPLGNWGTAQSLGVLVAMMGLFILGRSIWEFAYTGRGTLAPFDETHKLIVKGLYRYVRNPMYVGVVTILLGQSLFFWSQVFLIYSAICFVSFNIFIISYEEPRLRYKYGEEYRDYCKKVGRWFTKV